MKNDKNRKSSKQDMFSEERFNTCVQKKVDSFLKEFIPAYDDHRWPNDFWEDEKGRINSELSSIHASNPKADISFFDAQKVYRKHRKMHFIEALEKTFKGTEKEKVELFDFSVEIFARHKILDKLVEVKKRHTAASTPNNETPSPMSEDSTEESDFFYSRQVLVFSYLMNDLMMVGNQPNMTAIAKFIRSLTRKDSSETNIKNSNIYKKVKKQFFNRPNANLKDLDYVREQFRALLLTDLVKCVEKDIDEKKRKAEEKELKKKLNLG